jgi:hypothetical protein
MLDAESFGEATRSPDAADRLAKPFGGAEVALGPYAVARLRSR